MTEPTTPTLDERLTGPTGARRTADSWPRHKAKARAQRARRVRYGRAPRPHTTTR